MDPFYPFEIKKPAKNALNNRFDFQYPIIITSWRRKRDVLRYLSKVEGNGIRDSSSLFFIQPRIVREFAGRRWPETFTADCAPAEGHNACIKPLASHLIEMRGSFDRGAAIARIQSVIEKTRGSVGRSVGRPVFIFVSPLGPRTRRRAEKSFVRYHLHFARFVLVTSDRL